MEREMERTKKFKAKCGWCKRSDFKDQKEFDLHFANCEPYLKNRESDLAEDRTKAQIQEDIRKVNDKIQAEMKPKIEKYKLLKGVDDTKMGIGMRIAFVIYKLEHTGKKATFEEISKDPILEGLTKEQLKESLELMWDWGHLKVQERIRIESRYIAVYGLTYPETIRDLGVGRGWLKVSMEFL
jgi:hypothetical protein